MFRRSAMRMAAGAPSFVEQALHAVPVVGAPVGALTNSETYADLKRISEQDGVTHDDTAAEVTSRFYAAQSKLMSYRIARLSEEWEQFTANPVQIGALTPLYLAATALCAFIGYVFMYYRASGAVPDWFPAYADSMGLDGSSFPTLRRLGSEKYQNAPKAA